MYSLRKLIWQIELEAIIAKINQHAKLIVIIEGIAFKNILGRNVLHLINQVLIRENTY
jgi:hypothetical protein